MEISLSIFCAAIISLLFSDWAVMIAATHVSPLYSGISSEYNDEPPQLYNCMRMVDPDRSDMCLWWVRTTLSHIEGSATGHLRFRAARLAYVLYQS